MTCHTITGGAAKPRILWLWSDEKGMSLPIATSMASRGEVQRPRGLFLLCAEELLEII